MRGINVRPVCIALLLVALITPAIGAESGDGVRIEITETSATIENEFMRWEVSLDSKRFHTASLVNHRTGEQLRPEGEEFCLEFADGARLKGSDFEIDSVVRKSIDADGGAVVAQMSCGDVRARVVTAMKPDQWWAERYVEFDKPPDNLAAIVHAQWRCEDVRGPAGPGEVVGTLGYASGYGQPLYAKDFFLGIAHPGAENFADDENVSCRTPVYPQYTKNISWQKRTLVAGAGEAGGARHAFLRYVDATRPVRSRMIFLVNDWYWKDKDRPIEAMKALARVKLKSSVPIDSFTLDDGWDFDWDKQVGIWGRLNRKRFPGGWDALAKAGSPASINVSLWFGPIGGYGYRKRRIPFGREMGYEINGDKFCLAGRRYRRHVVESFSHWASLGMDYIKVDGFWPNCQEADHGHPVGPQSAVGQMDALIEVYDAWRQARPNLVIGYTSGSNPSPFWLQHADFVWRGGRDDSHAGQGEPFDRHNTYLDSCLHAHRSTEMPISAFVTFDIVQHRVEGNSTEGFERGIWWLAARTSLHHDWYVQATDLTIDQWKQLAQVARWARDHEKVFRSGRMIGGDPRKNEIYGFSSFDGETGTLALRNPGDSAATLQSTLVDLVDMPVAARRSRFELTHRFGAGSSLSGVHAPVTPLDIQLPPFGIAILELKKTEGGQP